jgi:magnesium transporter
MSENHPENRNREQRAEWLLNCRRLGPHAAAKALAGEPAPEVAGILADLLPAEANAILRVMPEPVRVEVLSAAPPELVERWSVSRTYPPNTIGRLMEPAVAVFSPAHTVAEAIELLRYLVKAAFITYGFVTEPDGKLIGVITMRDLLFSEPSTRLDEIMLTDVFSLQADQPLLDAMRLTLYRHYPVYPVCDSEGVLVGLVRGQQMFERQAIELSAQPGSMVGVEKEERTATPFLRSFRFRHPWLQVNLLTAFVAAAVVGVFEETIAQIVALAVFLPVLAGQSGNTGCQSLAVTLRGMTLHELQPGSEMRAALKEGLLGLLNGALVGLVAGAGMYVFSAYFMVDSRALMLGIVVVLAMTVSCTISGMSGVLVPVLLKKLGADPATASSIFLTTATDVASMGAFLGLASLLVL